MGYLAAVWIAAWRRIDVNLVLIRALPDSQSHAFLVFSLSYAAFSKKETLILRRSLPLPSVAVVLLAETARGTG